MAGKTLIGGTSYDISSGKTLVGSTSYKVKNGKVLINGTSYDISFLLPPAALNVWTEGKYDTCDTITGIAYGNGYWVVSGNRNGSACIAYATSLNGPWTRKGLWSGDEDYTSLRCITYANGYWVAGGEYETSYGSNPRIAWATSPNGSWSTKTLWEGNHGSGRLRNYINCIAYGNGYWVAGGRRQTSNSENHSRVASTKSLSGTWTLTDIDTGYTSTSYVSGICYANGYWAGSVTTWSSDKARPAIFYTSGAPTSFTIKNFNSSGPWYDNRAGSDIEGITYANGYWITYGLYADNPRVAYSTSLSGEWNYVDISVTGIVYAKGYYVASLVDYYAGLWTAVAYATSLDGPWTVNDLWIQQSATINGGGKSPCITYSNGYFVVGGVYYDYNWHNGRIAYASTPNELSGGT